MTFIIDASGRPSKTSDTEQLNQTFSDKYPEGTFVFEANGYTFTVLEEIVKKVCKSIDLVYEPIYGYVLVNSKGASQRTYKRAVSTLKKTIKGIKPRVM